MRWSSCVSEFVKNITSKGETWNCAYKEEDVCKCNYH